MNKVMKVAVLTTHPCIQFPHLYEELTRQLGGFHGLCHQMEDMNAAVIQKESRRENTS